MSCPTGRYARPEPGSGDSPGSRSTILGFEKHRSPSATGPSPPVPYDRALPQRQQQPGPATLRDDQCARRGRSSVRYPTQTTQWRPTIGSSFGPRPRSGTPLPASTAASNGPLTLPARRPGGAAPGDRPGARAAPAATGCRPHRPGRPRRARRGRSPRLAAPDWQARSAAA
jgi:hypothetical protein